MITEKKFRKIGKNRRIQFEELFEPTMKEKVKQFLESGSPVATFTKAILITATIGSVIAVGVMAPNLFRILSVRNSNTRTSRINKNGFYRFRRSVYQLRKRGLIEQSSGKDGIWHITEEGIAMLRHFFGVTGKEIPCPQRWDRKARLVLFDIPEEKREARHLFRQELQAMGFFQLQKSAWVHPFPCRKAVIDLATQLGVYNYVEVCTVEDLHNTRLQLFFKPLLKDIS